MCVIILSGGMDSATLLADLTSSENTIHVISFNYGQKHVKELDCAKKLVEYYGLRENHRIIDMSWMGKLFGYGSLVGNESMPYGMYDGENMKSTIVPNRNMIMLGIAAGYAISIGEQDIYYAAHQGDHTIYPDCRPDFVDAMNNVLKEGNWEKVNIVAPYIEISKSDIVGLGIEMEVPYELTWSCYEGGDRPCLRCGTCMERTEAFLENVGKDGIDPVLSREEWESAITIYAGA